MIAANASYFWVHWGFFPAIWEIHVFLLFFFWCWTVWQRWLIASIFIPPAYLPFFFFFFVRGQWCLVGPLACQNMDYISQAPMQLVCVVMWLSSSQRAVRSGVLARKDVLSFLFLLSQDAGVVVSYLDHADENNTLRKVEGTRVWTLWSSHIIWERINSV